jgi:radical SAM protein with 4Fe4S-binding SPASM domain
MIEPVAQSSVRGPLVPRQGAAELLAKHLKRGGAPVTVVFQVTDRCMYDCVHCYETHGSKPELDLAEIDRILGEIADVGTMFVTFTGGEFFMRRDADEILRAARRRKFAVKLLTTGLHIDDRRADLIHDLGAIQVDMSLYSSEAHIHDAITLVGGSWQKTLQAAMRLRARGVAVTLKTPLMASNSSTLPGFLALAARLGCEAKIDSKVTPREDGSLVPVDHRASDEALRWLLGSEETGVWETMVRRYANPTATQRERGLDETPCRAGQDVAGINPQGLVSGCQKLPGSAGDLRRQSFREIWFGASELKRLRELTWRNIEECNQCDVRIYCTRCHATALLEDGKLDGPSRHACRHAVVLRDLLRDRGVIPATDTALPPTFRNGNAAASDRHVRPPALRVIG